MTETHGREYINVAILDNIIEAQLIGSILDEQNMPHRIRSFHDTAYDGLFQFQMGWGEICAPPSCKQEIPEPPYDYREDFIGYWSVAELCMGDSAYYEVMIIKSGREDVAIMNFPNYSNTDSVKLTDNTFTVVSTYKSQSIKVIRQ